MLSNREITTTNNNNFTSKKTSGIGGTARQPQNHIKNLTFLAKSETEVIKVPKCTYANDVKEKSKYFLCQCSAEEFYPICEGCAKKCHNHHGPALELEGVYICMCGKTNHVITSENEKRFSDKKLKSLNQCFFTKFMEITPNRGIYKFRNTKICSICIEYCHGKKLNSSEVEAVFDEDVYSCKCNKHYELNVINLNVDLISKPKFHFHLQNFNFNILSKIPASRQIYLDYLTAKIDNYFSNMSEENSKNFFTNFINYKILELFSTFAVRWENKFFHVKNYLKNRSHTDIIDLLRFKEPVSIIEANKAPDFVNCKFYFAEYLFNYFVRTYQLKHNNLWNIRTILNMNLYQRLIYLHRIKDFQNFNFFEQKKSNQEFANIELLSHTILQLYEEILKLNEVYDCKEIILTYVFPTFNRIFKYLIKYNIVDDNLKSRYFDAVLDSINLANEAKYLHYHGSELYIIKSILYCLIYRNDHACLEFLSKGEKISEFVFCSTLEYKNLSKVFINVVNKYDREEDTGKTIIYDYYVRKIFELMIGKNEFFIKNLENLKYVPEYKVNLLLQPNLINETIYNRIDKKYMSNIVNFCTKLNFVSREYFDYNVDYETYLNQVNEILKDFKNFFYNDVNFLPDLTKKYQIFFNKYDANDDTINRILDLQTSVPYTLFFQKVEEFLHILSEGKRYQKKSSFNVSGVHNDYLRILLHFLFLLVNKNFENLALLMNVKPTVFVSSFIYIKEDLFNFLEVISEFLFSNYFKYKFDNYYFFTESINAILATFEFSNNMQKNIKQAVMLGRIMKISEKSVKFISMDQADGLNCVERIIEKLKIIKADKAMRSLLQDFVLNGYGKKYDGLTIDDLNDMEKFLTNYFSYVNALKFSDIYFLGLIKESDFLFDLDFLKDVVEKILNIKQSEILKFDVELETLIIKFYLQMSICFNFKINEGKNHLKNLLMKNIPETVETYSLRFLSRNPQIKECADCENLISNCELLMKVLKIFPMLFNKFSNHKVFNIIEKKVHVLSLFEFLVLRPLYKLLNFFLSDTSFIKGKESFYIFKMVFYFMSNTVFLYENCLKLFTIENNISVNKSASNKIQINNNNNQELNKNLQEQEAKLLQKIEILDYEDICIKGEIDFEHISELKSELDSFLKSEVKYFQLEIIYEKFISVCDKIIKSKNSQNQNSEKALTGFSRVFSTFKTNGSKQKQSLAKHRLHKLIDTYKETVSQTYDDLLAMINVLDSMESNDEIDIASELLYYLTMKLSDSLTDNNIFYFGNAEKEEMDKSHLVSREHSNNNSLIAYNNNNSASKNASNTNSPNINFKNLKDNANKLNESPINLNLKPGINNNNNNNNSKDAKNNNSYTENKHRSNKSKLNYKRAEIKDLNIHNFKFQNTYCLVFLNLLFFHDSGRFQGILEENFEEEDYNHFFNFLTCDLIFPCVLREADKNFELDKLDSSKKTLPHDIAFASIKFLQNLCENHNQAFQKKFFNHDFAKTIKVMSYPYVSVLHEEELGEIEPLEPKRPRRFLNIYRNFLNYEEESNEKEDTVVEKENENSILTGADQDQKSNIDLELEAKKNNLHKNNNKNNNDNNNLNISKNNLITLNDISDNKSNNALENNNNFNKSFFGNIKNAFAKMAEAKKGENNKNIKKPKQMDLHKKERLKEKAELRALQTKRVSFFNFIGHCERIIIQNLNLDSNSLLYLNKDFKNYELIMNVYQRLSDLIVEMIQGTENKNFENFYKKLPDKLAIFNKAKHLNNIPMLENFIFIKKAFEIQYLLFEQDPFEKISVSIKFNIFLTANNVINQELEDKSTLNILSIIFPSDKLAEVVSKYIRALYVKHILECDYEDANFAEKFEELELDESCYDALIRQFKANNDIFEDEFFKLASQIFLFLTILGEKYNFAEATKVLQYKAKDLIKAENADEQIETPPLHKRLFTYLKSTFSKLLSRKQGYKELNEEGGAAAQKKKSVINNVNNYIITSKFLSKIIYSCEFMIDSPNDEGDDLSLKKIYFIIDPRAYLISKNNIDNFFDSVDRTSSTTKIKSLIDALSFFQSEVEYKENFLKENSKSSKWLLEIEYKNVDFINFCLSLVINVIFMVFLKGGANAPNENLNFLIIILGLATVFINFVYLICFVLSKYKFYISIEKAKLENPIEISFLDRIRIYVFTSLLANEEIYLMILNILICLIGIASKKFTFLFALQLLTVVKFVPTIKEIVIAFKLRIFQLASMIAFLAILIFFYSIIGFYFFNAEFEMDLENGKRSNLCMNLLECWITHFNLGVRSGGGIGDLLAPKSFSRDSTLYWLRYVTDLIFFITVILLLLNMINGVIVSTFSQIREESNNKEEDISNKCFICNIDRMEFEKRKINFKWHLKHEHNSKTYIKFFICLGLIHEKDLDADQSFILDCIRKRDVYCFPVGKSSSVGEIKKEGQIEEEIDESGEDYDDLEEVDE